MSKRNSRGRRNSAAPDDTNEQKITFSSGYVGSVAPISYATFGLLKQREAVLFPEPELPLKEVEVAGGKKKIPVMQKSEEGLRFMLDTAEVARKRAEWRLDYFINHFLTIEGAEDEDAQQVILAKHEAELAMVAELRGEPVADDERWDVCLRHVIIRSSEDYLKLREAVEALTAPITDQEMLAMSQLFRRLVESRSDTEIETPGADGTAVAADG